MQWVRQDLRGETVCDLRFFDDNDRSDGVRIEDDDPRRTSDEEVDES
jgi:hypothetical protein